MNEISKIDAIGAAIRVGGVALGVFNPPAGVATIAIGEFVPLVGKAIGKRRASIFEKSIADHSYNQKVLELMSSLTEEKINRLIMDREKDAKILEDILNTYRKVMFDESELSIVITGIVVAKAIDESRGLDIDELNLIDALSKINDYDVVNYAYLKYQFSSFAKETVDSGVVLDEDDIVEQNEAKQQDILFSARKFANIGLFHTTSIVNYPLGEDGDDNVSMGTQFGTFYKRQDICDLLDKYVEQVVQECKI